MNDKIEHVMPGEAMDRIAKEHLDIECLETMNMDSLDFHEVAVWGVVDALQAAYEEGRKDASS